MTEPAQVYLGTCEVDVFEGFEACDQPGVVVYELGSSSLSVAILCIGHAQELGADVEFGPEGDDG